MRLGAIFVLPDKLSFVKLQYGMVARFTPPRNPVALRGEMGEMQSGSLGEFAVACSSRRARRLRNRAVREETKA